MLKAIFYKEWIKTRNLVALLAAIAVTLIAYSVLSTSYTFRTEGIVSTWFSVAEGDVLVFSELIQWFFIVAALAISAMQYNSEMVNKRLKLTLHLPQNENYTFFSLILYGICVLALLYLTVGASLTGLLLAYYPIEFIQIGLIDLIHFMLLGIIAYFFIIWVVVEPIWKRRVVNFLISFFTIIPFASQTKPAAYCYSIPFLLIIVLFSISCAYFSVSRFKDGAQN